MNIKKYTQFINEAKKDDAKAEILKMLEDKPTVTMGDNWPTEKGVYSQAGICKHLKGKYTTDQILGGLHDTINDKKITLKNIKVKNYHFDETYPHYYLGLTQDEAKDIKEKSEEKSEAVSKKEVDKRKESNASLKKAEEDKKRPKKVGKKVAAKKVAPKKVEVEVEVEVEIEMGDSPKKVTKKVKK